MSVDSSNEVSTKEVEENLGSSIPKILTIKQFCMQFPWPSESGIRSYIYRAEEFAMTDAFIRVGRRVLIDANKFFEIIQRGGKDCE